MMMVPRRNGFDIFDEVFNDPFFTKKESKLMKTDVREKDGNYVLDIDLPGYDKNDIKIELIYSSRKILWRMLKKLLCRRKCKRRRY